MDPFRKASWWVCFLPTDCPRLQGKLPHRVGGSEHQGHLKADLGEEGTQKDDVITCHGCVLTWMSDR